MQPELIQYLSVPEPTLVPNPKRPERIEITGSEEWKDETITLDSALNIKSGGILTLSNVKLILGNESNPALIYVESEGELHITDSIIISSDKGYGGSFMALPGSTFVLRDSEWNGVYNPWPNEGFQIFTDKAIIEGNVIKGINIMLRGTSSTQIKNNTIEDTLNPIIAFELNNSIIENNTISKSLDSAISLTSAYGGGEKGGSNNNIIAGNHISGTWSGGISVRGNKNIVENNKVTDVFSEPIVVEGSENIVNNNVIESP